jgi:uncharacterized protein (TIGR02186 family)
MIRKLIVALALFFSLAPAHAAPLVSDLSQYRIDMDANFSGSRLFLFGARNGTGDVIAVIRGPSRDFIVRKKEEIGGLWINRGRVKFFNVPDFYAVASSRELSAIEEDGLFRLLGIGDTHVLGVRPPSIPQEEYDPYAKALLEHQQKQELYTGNVVPLQFMGETLFKTTVGFPGNLPPGNYTAEIYLFSDGDITGMQTIPITVRKSGIDAFLFAFAHERPALYGFTAVVLALSIGWFAGRLFERT